MAQERDTCRDCGTVLAIRSKRRKVSQGMGVRSVTWEEEHRCVRCEELACMVAGCDEPACAIIEDLWVDREQTSRPARRLSTPNDRWVCETHLAQVRKNYQSEIVVLSCLGTLMFGGAAAILFLIFGNHQVGVAIGFAVLGLQFVILLAGELGFFSDEFVFDSDEWNTVRKSVESNGRLSAAGYLAIFLALILVFFVGAIVVFWGGLAVGVSLTAFAIGEVAAVAWWIPKDDGAERTLCRDLSAGFFMVTWIVSGALFWAGFTDAALVVVLLAVELPILVNVWKDRREWARLRLLSCLVFFAGCDSGVAFYVSGESKVAAVSVIVSAVVSLVLFLCGAKTASKRTPEVKSKTSQTNIAGAIVAQW